MLTPMEHYRLHGALPVPILERVLDTIDDFQTAVGESPTDISGDIAAGFPAEDCLHAEIAELGRLVAGMRKSDNKTQLQRLVADLTDKQLELARSAEYGREELAKACATWAKVAVLGDDT